MGEISIDNTNGSDCLTACLCKLQLPHSEEHAQDLPKPIMPTIQLAEGKFSDIKSQDNQSKRIQELLKDVSAAREEDIQLFKKFEKDADELLKAYKAGEKCDHWVPQELLGFAADQDTLRLQYDLKHSRFQLAEVRNQLHSLKRELATYEKLVRQEVGEHVNLHEILASNKWRGRAQEIKRLKAEIGRMERNAYDHKYFENPLCMPTYKPRFPDVDDLVPRGQAQFLEKEAKKKEERRGKLEQEVSALIEQYGNISLMYKASLTHNKMLAEELRSLKEKQANYENRATENHELVKSLIAHQLQMKQMIDREAHLARLVKKKQSEDIDLEKSDVLDAAKYKALLEACESEKCALEKMVEMLTRRLEDVIQTAEEAEKHCEDNETRRLEMEQLIKAQQVAAQAARPKSEGKAKAGKGQPQTNVKQLPTSAQLDAIKEENKFLRLFLLKAIETKVEDLKLYQFTMDSIREQLVEALKGRKNTGRK